MEHQTTDVDENSNETETLTVEFELDEIHAKIVSQMEDAGVEPSEVVAAHCLSDVERALYALRQEAKYAEPEA